MMKKVLKVTANAIITIFGIVFLGIMIFGTISYMIERETIGWITMICGDIVIINFIIIKTKELNKMVYSTKQEGADK